METLNLLNRDIRRCSKHPEIVKALIEYLVTNEKRSGGILCPACGCQVHLDWEAQKVMIGEAPTLAEFIGEADLVTLFVPDAIADAEVLARRGVIDRQGRFNMAVGTYGRRRILR